MKFHTTAIALLASITPSLATRIAWDSGYDNAGRSLKDIACSDGDNGLITRYGWTTQGSIATFPNIGGSDSIEGWNSSNCGTCFQVTWASTSIYFLAIDVAKNGIVMSESAMDTLTGGQAAAKGTVDGTVIQVDGSNCGLPQ